MVKIELLGGSRRSFPDGAPDIRADGEALPDVLERLCRSVPDGAPPLDLDSVLVALNGADSSVLRGAVVRDGDTISIIPIVHGGGGLPRNPKVLVLGIRRAAAGDPGLVDSLRAEFPALAVQIVRRRFVMGPSHAKRIVGVSLEAARRRRLLSNRLETDILMRFAGTAQISQAIARAGMRRSEEAVLIAVGTGADAGALRARMRGVSGRLVGGGSERFLRREFGITAAHIGAVSSPRPLEDILVERAVVMV